MSQLEKGSAALLLQEYLPTFILDYPSLVLLVKVVVVALVLVVVVVFVVG